MSEKTVTTKPKLIAAVRYAEHTLRHLGVPTQQTVTCVTYLQAVIASCGKRIKP